jgi:hypothetical protein
MQVGCNTGRESITIITVLLLCTCRPSNTFPLDQGGHRSSSSLSALLFSSLFLVTQMPCSAAPPSQRNRSLRPALSSYGTHHIQGPSCQSSIRVALILGTPAGIPPRPNIWTHMWLTPGNRALSGIDCASLAELRLAPAAVLYLPREQNRAEQNRQRAMERPCRVMGRKKLNFVGSTPHTT